MSTNSEIESIAAQWLARREGGWSEAERAQFEEWRDAAIAHRVAWVRLEAVWQRAARLRALGVGLPLGQIPAPGVWPEIRPESEAALTSQIIRPSDLGEVVVQRGVRPRRKRSMLLWSASAAMLVVMSSVGWWRFSEVDRASYATTNGEMRSVALADGSVVQLSSNTQIDVIYSRRQRHLRLARGEAFFEVAHEPTRPFWVEAEGRRVTAVGTRFAVRRAEGALRVAVTEGRVRLDGGLRESAVPSTLLAAGMIAIADQEGVRVRPTSSKEMDDLLSWRDGLLVFRGTPLVEAVAEFNRYSAHKLIVDDPAIASIPVGGSFRWSNNEAFVRVLEQGFGLHAERGRTETRLRGDSPEADKVREGM